MSTQNYTKQFETALEELNPKQREAVQQIEGPVMVLSLIHI